MITAVHPDITPEEREQRMKRIEDAIRKFQIAKERSERYASSDNI